MIRENNNLDLLFKTYTTKVIKKTIVVTTYITDTKLKFSKLLFGLCKDIAFSNIFIDASDMFNIAKEVITIITHTNSIQNIFNSDVPNSVLDNLQCVLASQ
tara:strand:+ start:190 stop:492 length:303 start_codon:yes stop_codon:yes gene_type:complete